MPHFAVVKAEEALLLGGDEKAPDELVFTEWLLKEWLAELILVAEVLELPPVAPLDEPPQAENAVANKSNNSARKKLSIKTPNYHYFSKIQALGLAQCNRLLL